MKQEVIYLHNEDVHNTSAAEIVLPILLKYVQPKTVLDVGCGIGTWLKVFKEVGAKDYLGVDGDYVDRNKLKIDKSNFLAHDLKEPLALNKKYDLVMSLEVAEHLPESAADLFVESLVKHSSVIMFSAAIPGQGGQNHLNEQWPSYWQEKFRRHGFDYYDLLRPAIWNNRKVDVWYRQNIFLLFHESLNITHVKFQGDNLVHPDFWSEIKILKQTLRNWENGDIGIENSFNSFLTAFRKKVKIFFSQRDGYK